MAKALPTKSSAAPTARLKVRAIRLGFYDHRRRRPGDVFLLAKERDFSDEWMTRVDPHTPLKETGAQAALNREMPGGGRSAFAVPDDGETPTGAADPLGD